MCELMELHYHRLASNGMKQLTFFLVTEGFCPPAIGPTLGARFALPWVQRSGSCSGPTVVDKRPNSISFDIRSW